MGKSGRYLADFSHTILMYFCWLLLVALATGGQAETLDDTLIIRSPRTELAEYQYIRSYSEELLALALRKSGDNFEFHEVDITLGNTGRVIRFIEQGEYDVHAFHTTPLLENTLEPVRIPIFKGVVGLRIPFIRAEDQSVFATIHSLPELKNKVAVQGFDWPDLAILSKSGLPIRAGVDLANMRHLLANERADYFPRSVVEIWQEDSLFNDDGLVVDTSLALYYRTACYYFVNKSNKRLKNAIRQGLELAIADGSFDEIFYRYFGAALHRANLNGRTLLEIPNANLSEATPLDRTELWYVPYNRADDRSVIGRL
ncbi:ABC-type amino acid transport substrate-binding protein [Alteromonadaceae bacterium 2753L.S.0a.02]|nr:ABC-type amino acid transport substrate-binding protein [Alteromonadaceae bacterium 2753L.S.0a.02]